LKPIEDALFAEFQFTKDSIKSTGLAVTRYPWMLHMPTPGLAHETLAPKNPLGTTLVDVAIGAWKEALSGGMQTGIEPIHTPSGEQMIVLEGTLAGAPTKPPWQVYEQTVPAFVHTSDLMPKYSFRATIGEGEHFGRVRTFMSPRALPLLSNPPVKSIMLEGSLKPEEVMLGKAKSEL